MNSKKLATATLIFVAVAALPGTGQAQTLEKIASSNQITVSYRESAVPFSYALSPTRAVGFSVDLTGCHHRRRQSQAENAEPQSGPASR